LRFSLRITPPRRNRIESSTDLSVFGFDVVLKTARVICRPCSRMPLRRLSSPSSALCLCSRASALAPSCLSYLQDRSSLDYLASVLCERNIYISFLRSFLRNNPPTTQWKLFFDRFGCLWLRNEPVGPFGGCAT
jgi:hypothetical protein